MKFISILTFILFISFTSPFSQSDFIKVKYKVVANEGSIENSELVKTSKVPNIYKGVDNALLNLEFQLDANKTNSHFYLKEGISINEKSNRIAVIIAGRDEVYIDNIEKKYVKVKNNNGEKINIFYIPNNKWTLTNESKDIEGFKCFKATAEKTLRIKKDEYKTHIVTAWYCPELPFSFGPKDYGNLPGLILELQDNKVTFIASKIELNISKINNLEINSKSKIITEEEYNKIIDSKTKELFDKLDRYNEKK